MSSDETSFPQNERYEWRGVLGRGSMGVVHRAFDREMLGDVALKVLTDAGVDETSRLKHEFRIVADLSHPNLIQLHDLVVTESATFFTMDVLDGTDVLSWIRVGLAAEELLDAAGIERLAHALAQIAAGLGTLHGTGIVHRDIKPPNVVVSRVNDTERVVLYDFGLAQSTDRDTDDEGVSGSPGYMSPEQLRGDPLEPSADWYAVGCIVHEALFGLLPGRVDGDASGETIPRWLAQLLQGLLRSDPSTRAGLPHVLAGLRSSGIDLAEATGQPFARVGQRSAQAAGHDTAPFVGREVEMAVLLDTFEALRSGQATVVRCHGESGIGKSELLRRFAGRVEQQTTALVLRGRCHPQETVPYKALDEIIEQLVQTLLVSVPEHPDWLPTDADALCRLFPALRRVPALAAVESTHPGSDPHLLRRRGATALRELLTRVGESIPTIVWIDDLQWADSDSAALLRDWFRPEGAVPVLLLLSYRAEDEQALMPLLQELPDPAANVAQVDLPIGPLAPESARELTARLLQDAGVVDERDILAIEHEAEGSPFFIGELSQEISRAGRDPAAQSRRQKQNLGQVIGGRINSLEPLERRLVQLAALSGVPIWLSTLLDAAGAEPGDRALLHSLENRCLVRSVPDGDEPTIQPYHDRIAEAAIEGLGSSERRDGHARIARALRQHADVPPEALVAQLLGAHEHQEAAVFASEAADRAAEALAFGRAADLYELAIEHGRPDSDPHLLRVRLAEAYRNAGAGQQAGTNFELAASELSKDRPKNDPEVVTLRLSAAEQFLQCGQIDHGTDLMRIVMKNVGLKMPDSATSALRSFVWHRVRILMAGMKFERRDSATADPASLLRMDTLWAAGTANSLTNSTLSGALLSQHLRLALKLGEPARLIRSFANEAAWLANLGPRMEKRADKLLETTRELMSDGGTPFDHAWTRMADGIVAWETGRFVQASEALAEAVEIYRSSCSGVGWETGVATHYRLSALAFSGALPELARENRNELRIANEHDDLFGVTGCVLGQASTTWLVTDEPDLLIRQADETIDRWTHSRFLVSHYHHLISTAQSHLYQDDPWAAWLRVERAWGGAKKERILLFPVPGIELNYLRGRAALAAAASGRTPPFGVELADPSQLKKDAQQQIRNLRKRRPGYGAAAASMLEGALDSMEGNEGGAAGHFEQAVGQFERSDMLLHHAAARIRLGELIGGDQGAAERDAGSKWMEEQGVVDPLALARAVVPA